MMRLFGARSKEERASALWGKSGKGVLVLAALALGLVAPSAALADGTGGDGSTSGSSGSGSSSSAYRAYIPQSLNDATINSPKSLFDVVVKGAKASKTADVAADMSSELTTDPAPGAAVKKQYAVINGVFATLSGKQIQQLIPKTRIASVTPNARVGATALSNSQLWPSVAGVTGFWGSSLASPAIAVVDSGVDASRAADFGARVIASASFLPQGQSNGAGDSFGHGTFVASIAAGAGIGFTGVNPGANIVSLDVLDDNGTGYVADIIDACDWILKHKDQYGIKVANFSVLAGSDSSFMYDPLDKAIEKLWLNGVVVVTAAGNYGSNGLPTTVKYAPANDPFAITVGAADIAGTLKTSDDFSAPWSAYGYTYDGFMKPELGAPGRYMNGAAPVASFMYTQHPERVVAPGYMWMSGTSFAAPVVSGTAAAILAAHPAWTPDQVKGALMLTAQPYSNPTSNSLGVGEVAAAAAATVSNPPNPNAALNQYLTSDPNGGQAFDAASWWSAASSSASWNSACWSSASWNSASWSSASWSSASWNSASWSSASWNSGTTQDGSLPSASWSSLTSVG
jgi:serine protease AprX